MSSGAVHLTINGQAVAAAEGATILQACRAHGIDVPTLCHCEGLPPVGACRLCIVEVAGQRRPTPACTTPVEDSMVVRTHTPPLEELRRQTLELIFGERNHICPFCPRSGNCELQTQAYRHGMDHVRYDYLFPQLPVDNSHPLFTLDHNRCILCGRCIRACGEWVGAHVFGFDDRGFRTLLSADSGVPLGESSCVSCGMCVSACPTGALFEKRCAHWQGRLPHNYKQTTCPGCGVGCQLQASVRHRQIGEVIPGGGPGGNRVLCRIGRFGLVNPQRARVTACRLREAKRLVDCQLVDVVGDIARRLNSPVIRSDPGRVVAFMSPRLPLETLAACRSFFGQVLGSENWSLLDRSNAPAVRSVLWEHGRPPLATIDDLDQADMLLLLGCNLERWHGVLASAVRRAVVNRRARLVEVDSNHPWFSHWTDLFIRPPFGRDAALLTAMLKLLLDEGRATATVPPELAAALARLDDADLQIAAGVPFEQIRRVTRLYADAQRPIILCGRGLTLRGPDGLVAAMNLVKATNRKTPAGRWRLMELALGANTAGAAWLGPSTLDVETFQPQRVELAFVVLADDDLAWPREWWARFQAVTCVVALSAREHEVLELAHAVVPTAAWPEREGTFINFEGRVLRSARLMPPPATAIDEIDFLRSLTTAIRGKDFAWEPPRLPPAIAGLAHEHLIPCGPSDGAVNLSGLSALAEA